MKILIIGIDGASWNILKPAVDEGYMPYLKDLIECGASGVLMSTKPAMTPPAWASFQTGVNPGKTGIFDFTMVDKSRRRFRFINSTMLPKTLWEIASENGKRLTIVNVPLTYPPLSINGYVVSGIFTPSMKANFTHPTYVRHELLKAVPDYQIFNLVDIEKRMPHREPETFVEYMAERIKTRAAAALYLMSKELPDIFMVHFHASDFIQHGLWGYMNKDDTSYSESMRSYIYKNFYQLLDKKIYEIRQGFEKGTHGDYLTFIISDHGFQTHKKRFHLAKWLHQQGYLTIDENFFKKPRLIRWLNNIDILNLRKLLLAESERSRMEVGLKHWQGHRNYFDWERTRAFSVGRNSDGFIFLLGKDKARQDSAKSELIERLKCIKDPETGNNIVKKIYHKAQIYTGDRLNLMPDLLVEPIEGYTFTGSFEPGANLFHTVNIKDDFHIGMHHEEGVFLAAGPVVQNKHNIKADIVDLAPTVLYCLDLPLLTEFDGRILREVFLDTFLAKHPVKKYKSSKTVTKQTAKKYVYSERDEDSIKERLKRLGYL